MPLRSIPKAENKRQAEKERVLHFLAVVPILQGVPFTPIDRSLLTRAYLPCSRGLTSSLSAASMSFSQL